MKWQWDLISLLTLIDIITNVDSGGVLPCPLGGGPARHVNRRQWHVDYRRQCAPGSKHCDLPPGTPPTPQMPVFTTNPSGFDFASNPDGTGTRRTTKPTLKTRTTPFRISFFDDCDYLAYYCIKAYQTGMVCARSFYSTYHSFPNYCLLDYVNCMEKHEVWQIVHMGNCERLDTLKTYRHYIYNDDYWLDQYYVNE